MQVSTKKMRENVDPSESERHLIERLERDVQEIRAEIEGNGKRFRRPSILERLTEVEEGLAALKATEREQSIYRKAFLAGLGALGILSAIILGLLYRLMQVIAGGGM
jgi:hypothetical protein